jgi:hypothetical protein
LCAFAALGEKRGGLPLGTAASRDINASIGFDWLEKIL